MPVVYIDVVWLVNFIMDAVTLLTAGWIGKRTLRGSRILAGAFIGATYALLLFAPNLSEFTTWFGKSIVSLLMVYVAIPGKSWLDLLRNSVTFYLVAFVFAGATIALHYAVPGVSVAGGTITSGHGLAFLTSVQSLALIVAVPLAYGVLRYSIGRARRLQVQANALYTVHVEFGEARASFVGLMDTGNQLRDPVTRRPVCLVDADALAPLLPSPIRCAALEGNDVLAALERLTEPQWLGKFTLVAYRGAGGKQVLTLGIRPSRISVAQGVRIVEVRVPCLLALHRDPLSVEGRFQAILHTELLTGDDGFEHNKMDSETEHEVTHSPATVVDSHTPLIR